MSEGSVIVFDGVCVLCSGWVRFLLRHDHRQQYRFAAMQSAAGRELLQANGLNADDPASFLLLDADRAYFNSDAIIRVLRGLGGAWRAAVLLRIVPAFIRDAIYVRVARNRYRWFGQRDICMRPEPQHFGRFIG